METASFLMTLTYMKQRSALGFLARTVAWHYEQEGLLKALPIKVPIELPPVGIITIRGRKRMPASEQLIECLRHVAIMA
jgi:DNA-binding transcriptional LysR family regulator